MSLSALALLLGAGALHAGWNLILKRTSERLLVSAWALLAGALAFTPLVVRFWPPPAGVWPLVIASCAVYLVYYTGLSRAYGRGDFSLIYPVARGAAPAMLTLWAVLFLGERPSPMGLLGITTILCGLVVLGGAPMWLRARPAAGTVPRAAGDAGGDPADTGTDPDIVHADPDVADAGSDIDHADPHRPHNTMRPSRRRALRRHGRGSGLALVVALCISVYTALDGAAVRLWQPIPYVVLVFGLSGFGLLCLLAPRERGKVFSVWRTHSVPVAAIAVMMLGAYAMVLSSFRIAPISYAGAGREVGIVFGALAGWLFLGERFGGVRTVGAVLVFAGVGLLTVAR